MNQKILDISVPLIINVSSTKTYKCKFVELTFLCTSPKGHTLHSFNILKYLHTFKKVSPLSSGEGNERDTLILPQLSLSHHHSSYEQGQRSQVVSMPCRQFSSPPPFH